MSTCHASSVIRTKQSETSDVARLRPSHPCRLSPSGDDRRDCNHATLQRKDPRTADMPTCAHGWLIISDISHAAIWSRRRRRAGGGGGGGGGATTSPEVAGRGCSAFTVSGALQASGRDQVGRTLFAQQCTSCVLVGHARRLSLSLRYSTTDRMESPPVELREVHARSTQAYLHLAKLNEKGGHGQVPPALCTIVPCI